MAGPATNKILSLTGWTDEARAAAHDARMANLGASESDKSYIAQSRMAKPDAGGHPHGSTSVVRQTNAHGNPVVVARLEHVYPEHLSPGDAVWTGAHPAKVASVRVSHSRPPGERPTPGFHVNYEGGGNAALYAHETIGRVLP